MPIKSDHSSAPAFPRSHSVPGDAGMMSLSEFTRRAAFQPLYDQFQASDDKIRSLSLHQEHLISASKKKDVELKALRRGKEEIGDELVLARTELGSLRETSREERAGIAGLKMDCVDNVKVAEGKAAQLRERVHGLEMEKRGLEGIKVGFREKVRVLEKEVEELRETKGILAKRNLEVDLLRQEKESYRTDKNKLIRERDEAKAEKSSLLKRIDELVDVSQNLRDRIEKQDSTNADQQRDLVAQAQDLRHLRKKRDDHYFAMEKFERECSELKRENRGLRRKIESATASLSAEVNDEEERPAKRLKSPQSAKDDRGIAGHPIRSLGESPGAPRSLSMSSPNDARHERRSGNEDQRFRFQIVSPSKSRHSKSSVKRSLK